MLTFVSNQKIIMFESMMYYSIKILSYQETVSSYLQFSIAANIISFLILLNIYFFFLIMRIN